MTSTRWLVLAERVYRMLLILYPADYRHEYGRLMLQTFRDVSRDKYRQHGMPKVMLWWCKTLLDLAFTVIEQRRKVKITMSKSTFVQLTGSLLILGGGLGVLAAFSQFQPDDHYTYHGIYEVLVLLFAPSFLFIGLGCIGLGMRYADALGSLGQWTLYLTGIGALLMIVAGVVTRMNESFRVVWFGSITLHLAALTVFGVLHTWKPVMPIFRALPLQIAAGLLVMLLGILRTDTQLTNNALSFLLLFGMGLAWLGIGMTLRRQPHEAVPVTA